MNLGTLRLITKHLYAAMRRSSESDTISPPLSLGELSVLDFLVSEKSAHSITDIVSHTGLAQSWVSSVVKSLVKRGWANVSTDKSDRRSTVVSLTETIVDGGRRTFEIDATTVLQDMLPSTTSAEFQIVKDGLELLAAIIQRQDDTAAQPSDRLGFANVSPPPPQ